MRGVSLTFDGLKIRGCSRAGDETWFRVDPPGLALDVGRGAPPLIGVRWIFLSHSHLDHTVGLPWVLTQRQHQGLESPTIFCPSGMKSSVLAYIEAGSRLEGEDVHAEVVGLRPGESRELELGLRLEAFETTHSVPALGCHLFRSYRKLRSEFEGLDPKRVAELKHGGVDVSRECEELWLSYCGDSSAKVFASEPRLFETKYLLVECTFIGPETRALGERFGHLHLQDLVELSDRFEDTTLVLYHLSRRHRLAELEEAVARDLPDLAARVFLMSDSEPGAAR